MRKLFSFVIIIGIVISLFGALRNFARYFENDAAEESKREQVIEVFDGTIPDGINVPDGETVVWYGDVDSFMNGHSEKLVTEDAKQTITSASGERVTYFDLAFLSALRIELTFAPTVGDVYCVHVITLNSEEEAGALLLTEAGQSSVTYDVISTVALNHFGANTVDACFEYVPTISSSLLDVVNSGDTAVQVVAVFVTKAP